MSAPNSSQDKEQDDRMQTNISVDLGCFIMQVCHFIYQNILILERHFTLRPTILLVVINNSIIN